MGHQGISRRRNDASRRYESERQTEAAKRLRLLADLIYTSDIPDNPLRRAADYIDGSDPKTHNLTDVMRFKLGLMVDLILNDTPNSQPAPVKPEILQTGEQS